MLTVADIFRRHAGAYLARFAESILPSHVQAIGDIVGCRTEAMGGKLVACDDCGHFRLVYHSCRNRACPGCHGKETARWLSARAGELLPVMYHHVVFTLPWQLRRLMRTHQRVLLAAVMQAAAESLQVLAADPRYAGGKLGILAVLHTWSRALLWHPHVHCLVPGIAVLPDRTWRRIDTRFLVPVQALSPIFRAKFAELARKAVPGIELPDAIWDVDWNIRSRPCFEGPGNVLRYLARYVFRGPMSNRRILGMADGRYLIQYRDSETRRLRTLRLDPEEFLRRYLQHTLPRGFHKIRYFGLWARSNRQLLRTLQLQLAPGLLELAEAVADLAATAQAHTAAQACPQCGSSRCHTLYRWRPNEPPALDCRGPP